MEIPENIDSFYKNYKNEGLSDRLRNEFVKIVYDVHEKYFRNFPWRFSENPYHVFVSEFMLQQTQAERVIEKFNQFIQRFPDFKSLADSEQNDVLKEWHGLGYNRRAIWLRDAAKRIVEEYSGQLPEDPQILECVKGIGHATAREMAIFAYNKKFYPFIETNIRRAYIYMFFREEEKIPDKKILEFIDKTADQNNPRKWGYAIMDFGVFLKKCFPKDNPNKKSKDYKVQSKFIGSNRQIRGIILKIMLDKKEMPKIQLVERTLKERFSIVKNLEDFAKGKQREQELKEQIVKNIETLIQEKFIIELEGKVLLI